MKVQILLDKIHLRIVNMNIVLKSIMNIHLVQLASRWPTLPSGLGDKTTVIESHMRRHNCVTQMRKVASVP